MATKGSTALWKKTTTIVKDAAKEGLFAHAESKWKCGHCKVKVRSKSASRLAFYFLAIWVSVMLAAT
jgi:hypothetical protein